MMISYGLCKVYIHFLSYAKIVLHLEADRQIEIFQPALGIRDGCCRIYVGNSEYMLSYQLSVGDQ